MVLIPKTKSELKMKAQNNIKKGRSMDMTKIMLTCFLVFLIPSCIMANWLFKNNKYEGEIEIKGLLVNEKDICRIFIDKNIEQSTFKELSDKKLYIVLFLKNIGNKVAWGEMNYDISGVYKNKIIVSHLTPNMSEPAIYIIPVKGIILKDSGPPSLNLVWSKLYNK